MATASTPLRDRLNSVQGLSNDELRRQLEQLTSQKHALDAELLLYLSELDERGLYREQACSSLFEFCMSRLGFSEDVAYKRVGVARMLRQYPLVFDLLSEGRIHMSALMLLRAHLTDGNHREWLLLASGKSKRQVEKLVAARFPSPDVPAQVRKLPEPRAACDSRSAAPADARDTQTTQIAESEVALGPSDASAARGRAMLPRTSEVPAAALPSGAPPGSRLSDTSELPTTAPTSRVQPLSGSSYRVVFTAPEALKQKLDRARELSSHAVLPSDLPALIERAIDLLIEHEERRRFATSSRRKTDAQHQPCQMSQQSAGASQDPGRAEELEERGTVPESRDVFNPRDASKPRRSRYVPAAVRRAIWQRDEGQCTFMDAEGTRCQERYFLEIEHRFPHAFGGPSSIDNCRLMCRSHNALRAELVFGRRKIEAAACSNPEVPAHGNADVD